MEPEAPLGPPGPGAEASGAPHGPEAAKTPNDDRGCIFDPAPVLPQGPWTSVASEDRGGKECCLFAAAFMGNAGPESQPEADRLSGRMPPMTCTFAQYLLLCCLVVGGMSCLAVGLWSGMGVGKQCLAVLGDGAGYRPIALGAFAALLTLLYLLDFFWPPHLPGQALALWDGDRRSRHWLLGTASALLVAAGLLSTEEDPSWPLLTTIALCPLSMAALRATLQRPRTVAELLAEKIALHGDGRAKAELLQVLTQREEDQLRFLWAALTAFSLSSAVVFVAWMVWALNGGNCSLSCVRGHHLHSVTEEDLEYLLWSTPLVVAVSDAVFGLFVALRLAAQRSYEATDSCKAQLLADQAAEEAGASSGEAIETARRLGIQRRERLSRQLALLMKVVSMAFIFLLGVLYIAGQLLYAESIMSSMIGGVLGLYLLVFVAFIYLAFRRIVFAMGQWFVNQPFWRFVRIFQRSNWTRSLVVCVALPFLPLVLSLSALNQRVRRCRGLYREPGCAPPSPAQADDAVHSSALGGASHELDVAWVPSTNSVACMPHYERPEKLVLTPRVQSALRYARSWDWLAVLLRSYAYCGGYLCYTTCPALLNVALSWLGGVLSGWPFGVVLWATFVIGVVAFLLPPVPGMTVYIFGGLVISRAAEVGGYGGFWGGSLINIAMCWLLKLVACALQQKCIGELLGQSLWVRKTVGVHKPHIRCIEAILREPGMSVGKVAILCGGPDWPTSVLAGVLRLSLAQCELGTTPIIFFVAPCALTGSFYLKRGVSEVWNRSAKLMIIVSVAINLLLWAIAAWAIQRQLERNHEELTRPRPENADLEWLDYRAVQLEKASSVTWSRTPAIVRWSLACCAGLQIIICQTLFWAYSFLFGDFQVEDNINDLDWFDTGAVGRKYYFAVHTAPLVLALFVVAWLGPLNFLSWRRGATRRTRLEAALELDVEESAWKERWLREAFQSEAGSTSAHTSESKSLPASPRSRDASKSLPSTPHHATPGETNSPALKDEQGRSLPDPSTPPLAAGLSCADAAAPIACELASA